MLVKHKVTNMYMYIFGVFLITDLELTT